MSGCPDDDCHSKVAGLCEDVRGKPGIHGSGLKAEMRDKVPKSWLWKFATSFGAVLVICGATTWYTAKSTEGDVSRLEGVVEKNAMAIQKLTEIVHKNELQGVRCDMQMRSTNEQLVEIKELIKKNNGRSRPH